MFCTHTWERVARDTTVAYPIDGKSLGIGPINGQVISVITFDTHRNWINIQTPDGKHNLLYEPDGITVN